MQNCQHQMSKQVHCNVTTAIGTTVLLMQHRPSDVLWKDFGAWIREHREKNHLSQAGAAQRAGIDRQQWYRIESGKSGTRRDTVIEIARAVSADINEALDKAGFRTVEEGSRTHELAENVSIKLNVPNLSPDDEKEIAEELSIAYAVVMARRKARQDKDEK
jgi:transcriptional regulator with XRE-family HTH domain